MAELMDDNVIRELRRKKGDFIVEIQISFTRTASPPMSLIPDGNLVPLELVEPIEMR